MSDIPNTIQKAIVDSYKERRDILKGSEEGTMYKFIPPDIMQEAEKASKEAQAILNDTLNKKGENLTDFIVNYKVANGICALARDNLAINVNRLQGIIGYLNELEVDIEGERLGAAIPGYESNGGN